MSQQEEHDALVEEIMGSIQSEIEEIKTLLNSIKPNQPISLEKLKALKAAVTGMSDAIQPSSGEPPPEGLHNISIGFESSGDEKLGLRINNSNVNEEHAAFLRSVYDAGVAAANAQEAGGQEFKSTLFFSDNGDRVQTELNNEAKKAAADVAGLEILQQAALAQLGEFKPVE